MIDGWRGQFESFRETVLCSMYSSKREQQSETLTTPSSPSVRGTQQAPGPAAVCAELSCRCCHPNQALAAHHCALFNSSTNWSTFGLLFCIVEPVRVRSSAVMTPQIITLLQHGWWKTPDSSIQCQADQFPQTGTDHWKHCQLCNACVRVTRQPVLQS